MVRTDNKKGLKGCKPSDVNLYKKLVYGGVNRVNDNFLKVYIFSLRENPQNTRVSQYT